MSIHPPSGSISIHKFQFDDFDMEDHDKTMVGEDGRPVDEPTPVFTLSELEEARLEAETTGRLLAAQEAAVSLNAEIAATLRELTDRLAELAEERRQQGEFIASEAVRLAALIARRVLPAFAESNAMREIETLITACFKDRPEESRLVIRLPDHLLDPVSARLEPLMRETGFASKPVLLADPALKRAEARIEWANGGAEWSFEAQLADLEMAAGKLVRTPSKTAHTAAADTQGPEGAEQETEL
jgi:flagellar assembly protein FliH